MLDKIPLVEPIRVPQNYYDKLQRILKILIKHKDILEIKEIWLFGSCARSTMIQGSDLDILILHSNASLKTSRQISFEVEKLDLRDDISTIPVDIVVRSYTELNSPNYIFNDFVKRDKKILWKREY